MPELIDVPDGLSGVAVTETEIGDVIGDAGYHHYRGRPATGLARTESFESVAALVLADSSEPIGGERRLPGAVADLVDRVDLGTARAAVGPALGMEPLPEVEPDIRLEQAVRLLSLFPTLVASVHHGRPVEPNPGAGLVDDYLRMLHGRAAEPSQVEALQAFFVLTIDHGFNNSTFAARVVASAGADLAACVLAGYCSLTGVRHGANTERMLDMFDAIGDPDGAEEWMRAELAAGRRLRGFGHSVYRRTDPRLTLIREHGAAIAPDRHRVAMAAEEAGTRLLAGRRLVPNLDLHAAVVLEGCGIPRGLFTATFAAARMVGWCAHALEQAENPKIFRPAARYVGPPPHDPVY